MKDITNAKPKVARSAKQSPRSTKTRNGELESCPSVSTSTPRVRRTRKPESRPQDQPSNDSTVTGTRSKPNTKDALPKTPGIAKAPASPRKRVSKRLTPAAVERLPTPIGKLDDAHQAKTTTKVADKQRAAVDGYDFGYKSGYTAGTEDRNDLVHALRFYQFYAAVLTVLLVVLIIKGF